jgi:colanic acid/amylovoran biosynthesis glycosyltransferase
LTVITENQKEQKLEPTLSNSVFGERVAFIVSRFPKLTETFVLDEILEMKRLGVYVDIYPLIREREKVVQAEVVRLIDKTHFHSFMSLPVLRAQLHFIRRRPGAYFKALFEALRGTLGSAKFFIGALAFFPKAVRFAYEIEQEDITHVHSQFANHPALVALIIYRLIGIPFSFTARGSDIHVDRTMLKEKLEAAAFAITVSKYNKEMMVNEGGPHVRNKIHVVYGGIDTDVFKPSPNNNSDRPAQILCVSRFEEVKGHTQLVEACRLLHERGVEFECHLVGDGDLRPKIEQQIAQDNLKDKVLLSGAGTRADVVEKLASASVFVLATAPTSKGKREGIPNVLKEAMACGVPVVGSFSGGIPELVDNERSGILVPARDSAALADALQRLIDDPALRQRMGQAGREKILQEFNLQTSVAKRARLFFNGY